MDHHVVGECGGLVVVVHPGEQLAEVTRTRQSLQPGPAVEQSRDILRSHTAVADEVDDQSRIEIAGAGAHNQAPSGVSPMDVRRATGPIADAEAPSRCTIWFS